MNECVFSMKWIYESKIPGTIEGNKIDIFPICGYSNPWR